MHELRLTLPIAPTVNHSHLTTRTGKRIMKPETREYKDAAALMARAAASLQGFQVDNTVRLLFEMHIYGNRNGYDLDNREKHIIDALADGVGFNDKQIDQIHVYRKPKDKDNPRCEVVLRVIT